MRSPASVCSEISSVVVLLWGLLWFCCDFAVGAAVDDSDNGPPIKRRKRHRRKHFQNQEPCLMRGVYFIKLKWRAAIKVHKKQIHLGSQKEAARLYDRAAFMRGREPNFELSEKEKQELRKFKWEEFLAITRHGITSKKHEKACGERRSELPLQNSDWDG